MLPLNNDHLSTTASILGSQGLPLYTGLTVDGRNRKIEGRDREIDWRNTKIFREIEGRDIETEDRNEKT